MHKDKRFDCSMPKLYPVTYVANTEVKIYHNYSNMSRKKKQHCTVLRFLHSSQGGKSINLRQTVKRYYFVIPSTTTKRMIIKGIANAH